MNIKKHSCIVHELQDGYISNPSISDEQKDKILNDIHENKINNDEKYLILAHQALNEENRELAKTYINKGIDSINKNTCNLVEGHLYKFLADIEIEENNIEKALEYVEIVFASIDHKDHKNNKSLISDTIKSITSTDEGREIAIKYLNEILECKNLDANAKTHFMRLLSACHILNNNYAEAILLNVEILKLGNQTNNKYYMNKSIIDISIIARDIGGYETAIEILNKVSTKDVEDEVLKADLEIYRYINLAQIQNILNMNEEAIDNANKINEYEQYIAEPKRSGIIALKNIVLAESYINNNDIDLAKYHLSKAVKDLDIAKDIYVDIEIYYNIVLGKISMKEKNYQQAKENFEYGLNMLDEISNKEYEKICLIYLMQIYEYNNDMKNVSKYGKKLKTLQDDRNGLMLNNYYKYIGYKESYEHLKEDEINSKHIIRILFIVVVFLVVFVIKVSLHPYLINKRNQNKVKSYLKGNNYILNYQPIINPKTNKIIAFESLLRLKLNEKIIYPDTIINEIERCNMMAEVSTWILEKLIKEYDNISEIQNLDDKFYLSMNVSLKEIEDEKICNKFIDILKNSNLNEKSICLEITENTSGEDYIKIRNNIRNLMDNGFIIALDDFGVEYSNLSFLEKLDFNIIKLDKYFIDNYSQSIVVQSLIDAINNIAIKKDLSIVVEGVEEEDQLESIKNIKSDKFYIQGYYYSKPIEIEKLPHLIIK